MCAADALGPLSVNLVLGEQVLVLVELRGKTIEERGDGLVETPRQVLAKAPDPPYDSAYVQPGIPGTGPGNGRARSGLTSAGGTAGHLAPLSGAVSEVR